MYLPIILHKLYANNIDNGPIMVVVLMNLHERLDENPTILCKWYVNDITVDSNDCVGNSSDCHVEIMIRV